MQKSEVPDKQLMSDDEIDENLEDSFPASDPPSWNLGTNHVGLSNSARKMTAGTSQSDQETYLLTRPVSSSDHIQGADSASVTLLMYGAYECPHCVEGNKIVKQIQERLGKKIRFAFRHFPRINVHPHAEAAAEVAEAAGEQNRFWEMHDKLFENYNRLDGDHLIGYAKDLGLDIDQFDCAITRRAFITKVQEDLQSGLESGVKGTPTYFINGVKHHGAVEFDVLLEAVESNTLRVIF